MNNSTRSTEPVPPAGLGAVANSDIKARSSSAAAARAPVVAKASASSFETVAGDVPVGADHATAGRAARAADRTVDGKKQKICCHCGKDVAREERFKDKAGYYWCMDCGVQENREKHAIGHAAAAAAAASGPAAHAAHASAAAFTCPDCSQPVPPGQVVEYEHVKMCNDCAAKRQKHAAREAARAAARQAAVAEAAIDEARRRRHMVIGAAVVALLAVAWMIYSVAS